MQHEIGTPCWVQTFQPDPSTAAAYYAALLGWEIDPHGDARLGGRLVAGIRPAPGPAAWAMYVRVDDVPTALERIEAAGGRVLDPAGVVADADGVPFGVTTDAGVEVVDEPGAWAMSALHAPDPGRAEAFYGTVFGWRPHPAGSLTMWRAHDRVVAVMTPAREIVPHWAINVRVRDADATAQQAASLGGTVLMAPFDAAGLRNAVLADPAGAVIAVSAPGR